MKKSWEIVRDNLSPDPALNDIKGEQRALDAMLEEREKATAISSADRKWEEDRKKEWQANKPYWKKQQEAKKPKSALQFAVEAVKSGGIFEDTIHPLQGYILTKIVRPEKRTEGGIILPDNKEEEPNTAVVIESGPGYFTQQGDFIKQFVDKGEVILFRKFAGMNVNIKGEDYLFLHFDDVIARFEIGS